MTRSAFSILNNYDCLSRVKLRTVYIKTKTLLNKLINYVSVDQCGGSGRKQVLV